MSALARFEITGPASPGRTRAAGLIDLLAAVAVAMIAVPQPVVRQAIMAGDMPRAVGITLFVAALVAISLVVFTVYLAFSAVTWGRSPGMYLLDLGLAAETKPTLGEAFGWAAGWTVAVLPAVAGFTALCEPDRGLPSRFSGVPTRSTASLQAD